MKKLVRIAIDGPVAAGKGTAAKILAQRLGFLYVDTGAMYRVATWLARKNKIDFEKGEKIAEVVEKAKIEMRTPSKQEEDGRLVTVEVDEKDLSWEIRGDEITKNVATVAKNPQVRTVLVKKQQQIAEKNSVVMEGRDIGLRVLPKADLKIYLTASLTERAKRRHKELLSRGEEIDYKIVEEKIAQRDEKDMNRKTDPLKKAIDAWELDTSQLTIQETVDAIETKLKERKNGR